MTESTLPLAGVTVLDLTRLPPGGFCTVLLADLGATVIRVESPKKRMFDGPIGLNRGKYSVAVDLRHPRGHEVLRRLAAHADILIENERPGAMDERGFGYSQAAAEFPRLIWCSVSGYGQDGPYAEWSGHDLAFAAHSGALSVARPGASVEPAADPGHPHGRADGERRDPGRPARTGPDRRRLPARHQPVGVGQRAAAVDSVGQRSEG